MKKAFVFIWGILLCGAMAAQSVLNIQGLVTQISDGAPVPNWFVFAQGTGPDTSLHVFAYGETNANGIYNLTLTVPAGFVGEFTVSTWDACYDINGNPVNSNGLSQVVTPVNGLATADFQICNNVPTAPNCFAGIDYYQDVFPFGFQFIGSYFNLDSTLVGTSWLWDFGDGTQSTDQSPNHQFLLPGGYNVSLTVTGADGCTTTTTVYIYVNDPNTPFCFVDFYFFPDSITPLTFHFSMFYFGFDPTSTAASYLWDFGDGTTSTVQYPSHTYAANGLYFVTLTVTGTDGCTATSTYPLSTDIPPPPDCLAYMSYLQNSPLSFDFQGFSSNVYPNPTLSYHWDFGDGNSSTEQNPSHTYAQEGIYTVLFSVFSEEDSCEAHACEVVFAYDNTYVDTFFYGCQAMFGVNWGVLDSNGWINPNYDPLTVSFYDWSMGIVQSWNWNFGDSTTSTEQNPVHTYAADGLYTVTLSIVTLDGCESTISFEIYIGDDSPWVPELDCQALFIPMPDSIGGNGIQFFDLSYAFNPIQSWSWDFGDGTTSNQQNPYHEYAQPGTYVVTLSIESVSNDPNVPNCNSEIAYEIDTENPWNFNATAPQLGRATNTSSVKNPDAFQQLTLFPNPATQQTSIVFEAAKAFDTQLRITDLSGRTLQTTQHATQSGANRIAVDVSRLVPGMYLVELRSEAGIQTLRLVKE